MEDELPGGRQTEECWACQGYGVVHGPLREDGSRERWHCPWCRGTAVLFDGSHERGAACDCCPRDFRPGDDWFTLTGHEIDGVWRARLPVDPEVRALIEEELDRDD